MLAAAGWAAAGPTGAAAPSASLPSVRLTPDTVRMGAFYGGATLRIEGEAPTGSEVVIVVRGAEGAEFFNRKARVGPVWISVDRVHVCRAPSLLLRFGGGDLRTLLDDASIDAYQLDDSAVRRRMSCRSHCRCRSGGTGDSGAGPASECATGVEPDPRVAGAIRASYVALKTREGAYRAEPEAVRMTTDAATGARRFTADVRWPRTARPGVYQVDVLACRNRSVVAESRTALKVVQAGLPARVGALARAHPTAYGVGAVLAAALGGFAMDSLVGRRRTRGRGRTLKPPPVARAPDRPARAPDQPTLAPDQPTLEPARPTLAPEPVGEGTAEEPELAGTYRRG